MREIAYAAALTLLLLVDCRQPRNSGLRVTTTEQVHGGIRFVHLAIGAFDPAAPLLVALHGRGSSPERFDGVWRDMPFPLEIALPQGFERFRFGWQWFNSPMGITDDAFAAAVSAAEQKLWPALVEAAHGRKLIVSGHSQGAIMAYVIATRHPEIVEVLPVSGFGPHSLMLRHAPMAPVYALHGVTDETLSVDLARRTVADLRAAGGSAELREFPGAGHGITEEMRRDLFAHIAQTADAGQFRAGSIGIAPLYPRFDSSVRDSAR
jgi:phospholipase/carboxylesterase